MPQKKKNQDITWPNLPQHLINKIAARPSLMQTISFSACLTKSWRSPSKKCTRPAAHPHLVQIERHHARPHRFGITFHEVDPYPYWSRMRKEYRHECIHGPGMYMIKGHSHGQAVVMDANKSACYLWNPATRSTTWLPSWEADHLDFKLCTLSSSSSSPRSCNAMVVTGSSSLAFFASGRSGEWVVEDFDVNERCGDRGKKMQFVNGIGFEGKFYALSSQGSVVVIEDVGRGGSAGSRFGITRVGGNRGLPRWRRFREYLVECEGEILMVFLGWRKGMDAVDDVKVFRLQVGEVLWVEVEGIGVRALFLEDECCMCVDARRVGCKRNCIYFTHHNRDWWVFDMETRKISPVQESEMWDNTEEIE